MEEKELKDKVRLLKTALRMQRIQLDDAMTEQILRTFEKCEKVGWHFTVRDAVEIECDIEEKYRKEPEYEYEVLFDDEDSPFEMNSWIPIATDRIKDPSRIDEYIKSGRLRKIQRD